MQSSDFNNELSTDLKVLQENLQTKFGTVSQKLLEDDVAQALPSNVTEGGSLKRKISVGYQEEKFNSRRYLIRSTIIKEPTSSFPKFFFISLLEMKRFILNSLCRGRISKN